MYDYVLLWVNQQPIQMYAADSLVCQLNGCGVTEPPGTIIY